MDGCPFFVTGKGIEYGSNIDEEIKEAISWDRFSAEH